MPPNRVFFDTNVWFSAFYGSPHAESIVKAHLNHHLQAVICEQILHELVSNIKAKIPQALPALYQFLSASPPQLVKQPVTLPLLIKPLAHPKDAPLIVACYQAKVPYFVTGNTKDFHLIKIKRQLHIDILTPAQAVKLWQLI